MSKKLGVNDDARLVRLARLVHEAETKDMVPSAVRRLATQRAKSIAKKLSR